MDSSIWSKDWQDIVRGPLAVVADIVKSPNVIWFDRLRLRRIASPGAMQLARRKPVLGEGPVPILFYPFKMRESFSAIAH